MSNKSKMPILENMAIPTITTWFQFLLVISHIYTQFTFSYSNNNTQEAASAIPPLTTHPGMYVGRGQSYMTVHASNHQLQMTYVTVRD